MLKRIPAETMREGFRLPGPLRNRAGRVLVAAGTHVTQGLLDQLGTERLNDLYADTDWPEDPSATVYGSPDMVGGCGLEGGVDVAVAQAGSDGEQTIEVQSLCAGMRLADDIRDGDGLLLLAAGTTVTPRFLVLLRDRGLEHITLRPPTAGDEVPHEPLPIEGSPHPEPLELEPQSLGEFYEAAHRGSEQHRITTELVEELCDGVMHGHHVSGAKLYDMIHEFAQLSSDHNDLLPFVVGQNKSIHDTFFQRCVNVGLVSMAMAQQFGMTKHQVTEIGVGAVLQDIGMLRVPESIRHAQRPLTNDEWIEVRRHPVHTLDYLERIYTLPVAARYIGYQVHERNDGSGYPRGRSGMLIHQYAKIVAVADAYDAMTSPRPYRPALTPYMAAKALLLEGSKNRFDRTALRAFLDSVSLFPIGSFVVLDDGQIAKVVRATAGCHTQPVVQLVERDGSGGGPIIDLRRDTSRKIVRALSEKPTTRGLAIAP